MTRQKTTEIAQGADIAAGGELTAAEAAGLLNVPAPYLETLLDAGVVASREDGAQRWVRMDDLLAYQTTRDAARREALRELTRMSQAFGEYDRPVKRR